MQLAKVVGNLVATQKVPGLTGIKFLIVQKIDADGASRGEPLVAVDSTAQAGLGEWVMIEGGKEACFSLEDSFTPADQSIVAIVDTVHTTTA